MDGLGRCGCLLEVEWGTAGASGEDASPGGSPQSSGDGMERGCGRWGGEGRPGKGVDAEEGYAARCEG